MTKVSRDDVFIRSEKGGEWFNEFLRICRDQTEVLEAVVAKKSEGVAEVVQQYREMVGLDLVEGSDTTATTEVKKEASISKRSVEDFKPARETKTSKAGFSFLSIRQAKENMVSILESSPELKIMIDSFCEGSGGTKSTHSIINFLREKLGNELVSFSDQELKDYIEQRKEHYKEHVSEDAAALNVGRVGLSPGENYEDHVADYMTHGK